MMGTVAYMSPEYIRGLFVDHRADLWSLGVVMFEMLTGRLPFTGEYPEPLMYSIVNEAPKPLTEYLGDIPGDLQCLMDIALRKTPEERYQDAASFLKDLRQLKKSVSESLQDKPLTRKVPQRKRRFSANLFYAALVIFVILLGLGFYLQRDRSASPEGPFSAAEWQLIRQAKQKKLVIAIAPFWGSDKEAMQEGKVMQALIARRLYDELGQETQVNILEPEIAVLPRSHQEAKSLGEKLQAALVIWGEVFILRQEVEIQPFLTLTKGAREGWRLSTPTSSSALKVNISEPHQLSFRRSKAKEVGNLALLISGRYYFRMGNDEAALNLFQRISPPDPLSLALIGDIYAYRSALHTADSLYRESLSLDTTNAGTYLRLAVLNYNNYQPQKALEFAHRALELDANLPDTYKILGPIYAYLGQKKKAIASFEQGLQVDPQNADLYFSLGWEYYNQFKYDQAVAASQKALEIDPSHEWAYIALGRACRTLERYQESTQALQKAIVLNPLNELSYRVLGNTYASQGKDDLALEQFLKARDVEPNNHFVYYNLGHFYWKKEKYDKAIATWQQARKLAPKAPFYRYFQAITYLIQRHYQKVEEIYQTALNDGYEPDGSELAPFYSYFGYIQDIRGEKEEALKFYRKRLALGRSLLIAALYYFALNDLERYDDAATFLKKFAEDIPASDSWQANKIRFLLGDLSEKKLLTETSHPISSFTRNRQCEAYFYMGKNRLLKSSPQETITAADSVKAREFFIKSLNLEKDCYHLFDLRFWANMELERLETSRALTLSSQDF
jgi:tetratricopeptide (TPR) repeat protein